MKSRERFLTTSMCGVPDRVPIESTPNLWRFLRPMILMAASLGSLCGNLQAGVLKEATGPGGDRLVVLSLDPAPGKTLKGGDRFNVRIGYENASAKAVRIWASGDSGFFAASETLTEPKGEVTRFIGSNEPAEMSKISVSMVDASDGKNGKTLVEVALDAAYKWEGHKPGTEPVVFLNQPFPELKFKSTDGQEIDLAKLKGKVVLIDFWATWCGPCKAKMPELIDAYAKCKDLGFEIVGISLDSDLGAMKKYLSDQKITWPQYFDGKGWSNELAARFRVTSIPRYYLLDRKGIVREQGANLTKTVQELCAAAP